MNFYVYANNDPVNRTDPLGLFDTPWDIYDQSVSDAQVMTDIDELSCMHNGPADAFKHCLASCRMTQEYGEFFSELFGWVNEVRGSMKGQPKPEANMDFFNNDCGDESAEGDCFEECLMLAQTGQLITISCEPGMTYDRPY